MAIGGKSGDTAPSSAIRRFLSLLSARERLGLVVVLLASIVAAVFETAGVLSILPFMTIVLDPGAVERYGWLSEPLTYLGANSHQESVVVVGFITAAALALGNAASASNIWIQETFISRMRQSLSSRLFSSFMRQPYDFHLRRDAPSLIKVAIADVDATLMRFVSPLLTGLARGLVALGLLALILLRDTLVAVGVAVVLGGSYWIIYHIVRDRQGRLGTAMNLAVLQRSRSAMEGLGGIKELRVLGREDFAVRRYTEAMRLLSSAQVSNALTSKIPRYVLEVVAFGGIIATTIFLVMRNQANSAIPMMALYAFAGYRLMPAFQQMFASAVSVRFSSATVASLEADLDAVRTFAGGPVPASSVPAEPLPFERAIRLDHVSFEYKGTNRQVLKDVSLTIRRNESIGIAGRSGSGKSTLIDLMLGLHLPTRGTIFIDDVPLSQSNEREWRRQVGYVPQSVFLANASVWQNISFGLPGKETDRRAVEKAAKSAQADEFIRELPQGYDTQVGERGVKLSGGQRQRLGIARALYHEPDVLVFDEATSALDGMTETAVMEAVRRLSADRTFVLIAHRLSTIKACDRIVVIENGEIAADGAYDDLMASSLPLKRLATRS